MRKRRTLYGALSVLALSGMAVTCGDDPKSAVPTGPSAPAPLSLTIIGPGTIAPGQTVQYVANIVMSDGSIKAATAGTNVLWRATPPALVQVSSTGLVTARQQMGDILLTAEVAVATGGRGMSRGLSREIVIVPEGTYRMVGTVVDAEFPTERVPGARVEVMPGSLVTITNTGGGYRLYGVPANSTVQVSRDGYHSATRTIELTTHSTQDFQLAINGPRLNLAGNYTLAVDVPGGCSSLPSDLQHRRYDATITQTGVTLDVTLTEPRFRINSTSRGNRFTGKAQSAGATFTLEYYNTYYYAYYGPTGYPNVAERLSDGTHLVIEGSVTTNGSNAGLSGQLNGDISRWDSRFPTISSSLGSCVSQAIQFTLTPR